MNNDSFGKYIAAINRSAQSLINKKLEGVDIGSGQHDFLYVISNNEGISQKELSNRLKIGKATTAKAVKNLMKSGYIKREKDIKDKRFYKLYLTEKGMDIKPLVNSTFQELIEIYSKGFTVEECTQVLKVLEKILDNVYNAARDIDCE